MIFRNKHFRLNMDPDKPSTSRGLDSAGFTNLVIPSSSDSETDSDSGDPYQTLFFGEYFCFKSIPFFFN